MMTTPQPQVPSTASNIDPAGSTDPRNLEEQSTAGASPTDPQSYPEQKHAGAVGYGPNFRFGPTVGDKAGGLMEEMRGKIMHNQEHVHHGHDRRTGELKKSLPSISFSAVLVPTARLPRFAEALTHVYPLLLRRVLLSSNTRPDRWISEHLPNDWSTISFQSS